MSDIKAPRGTLDVLGDDSFKWQFIEKKAAETAIRFGCKEVRFPTFEETGLFQRGVGDTTDIVQKEMYTFLDKGGRSVTLRPEGTASVVRQCSEHGLFGGLLPLKLFYFISAFRYEKPQAGRFREFHQFGVEMFGPKSPSADTEVISLAHSFLTSLGIKADLYINSIGCPSCRANYQNALREFFSSKQDDLCETCRGRLERNPMRILDCKSPICGEIAKNAPVITDFLCTECSEHYEILKNNLTDLGIDYILDPGIVRGLDYYTKTVFEFKDPVSGLAILAGGRYDGLVKEIDGKADVCGLGFASGIERLVATMERDGLSFGNEPKPLLFVASIGDKAAQISRFIVNALRKGGVFAECDLMDRSLKAQMKYADKIGAGYVIILGENEVESGIVKLKNMSDGSEVETTVTAVSDAESFKKIIY